MRKTALALVVFGALAGQAAGHCSTTVVSHETDKWFFKDGRVEHYEGQYENTYLMDLKSDTLVRTRVYDYQAKKITPDETRYQIQKQLNSDPTNAARFGRPEALVRAFGQTGPDTVEILVIRDNSVETSISSPDQIVVSSAKRLK